MSRLGDATAHIDLLPKLDEASIKRVQARIDELSKSKDIKLNLESAKLKTELAKIDQQVARATRDRDIKIKADTALAEAKLSELEVKSKLAGERAGNGGGRKFAAAFDRTLGTVGLAGTIGTVLTGALATIPALVAPAAVLGGLALGGILVKTAASSIQSQEKTLQTAIGKLTAKPASPQTIANKQLAVTSTQNNITRLENTKKLTSAQKATLALDKQRLKVQQQSLAAAKQQGTLSKSNQAQLKADKAQLKALQKQAKAYAGVTNAAKKLKSTAISVFGQAIMPLMKPFTKALTGIGDWLSKNKGLFKAFFAGLGPYVPMVTHFFEGLVKSLLPAFTNMFKKSQPAVKRVLDTFHRLVASGIVGLFNQLTKSVGPSSKAFERIMSAVIPLLPAFGKLIGLSAKLIGSLPLGVLQGIVIAFTGMLVVGKLVKPVTSMIKLFEGLSKAIKFLSDWEAINTAVTRGWAIAIDSLPWVALIAAVIAVTVLIIKYHKQIWHVVMVVWHEIRHLIDDFVNWFTKSVPHAFDLVLTWIKKHWPLILSIVGGPVVAVTLLIVRNWSKIHDFTVKVWDTIKKYLNDTWSWIWGHIFKPVGNFLHNYVMTPFDKVTSGIKKLVHELPGAIKSDWDKLKSIFMAPVKWVVQYVYDDAIVPLWDHTIAKLGGPNIKPIDTSKFAAGGHVPGFAPGVDSVPAMLSPGEFVLTPEAVSKIGVANLHALNKSARTGTMTGGNGHFGFGGWNPVNWVTNGAKAIGHAASSAWSGLKSGGKWVWDKARNLAGDALAGVFSSMINPMIGHIPTGGGAFGKFVPAMVHKIEDQIVSWVKGNTGQSSGNGPSNGPAGGATGSSVANAREGLAYLAKNVFGGSARAAAGAVASIYGESAWNPFAQGTGGRGLIGWTPPGTISNGAFSGGMKTQLPAIVRFISTSGDWGVIAQMKAAAARNASLNTLAQLWGRGVERYGINDVHPAGISLAQGLLSKYKGHANGGSINEPVYGFGAISGMPYSFGERGRREKVVTEGQQVGQVGQEALTKRDVQEIKAFLRDMTKSNRGIEKGVGGAGRSFR